MRWPAFWRISFYPHAWTPAKRAVPSQLSRPSGSASPESSPSTKSAPISPRTTPSKSSRRGQFQEPVPPSTGYCQRTDGLRNRWLPSSDLTPFRIAAILNAGVVTCTNPSVRRIGPCGSAIPALRGAIAWTHKQLAPDIRDAKVPNTIEPGDKIRGATHSIICTSGTRGNPDRRPGRN